MRRENLSTEVINNPEKKEYSKEDLEEMISGVDFDSLKQIFNEKAEAVGHEGKKLNLLDKENIDFRGRLFAMMTYDAEEKKLHINTKEISEALSNKTSPSLAFLHCFIHEQTHIVSFRNIKNYGENKKLIRSGYHETERRGYHASALERFVVFNEALTDKLSIEIFKDYAEKNKLKIEKVKIFLEEHEQDLYQSIYMPTLDLFIEVISKAKNIKKEKVWDELVKGYLGGEDLFTSRMTGWANKIFGKDFIERLAYLETGYNKEKDKSGDTFAELEEYLKKTISFTEKHLQKKSPPTEMG